MRAQLRPENPSPFRQPFLVLRVRRGEGEAAKRDDWHIDVDSQVHEYVRPWAPQEPTERLLVLCRLLASRGDVVEKYSTYVGSAGPRYILRCGALFRRMIEEFERHDDQDPSGEAVGEITAPVYDRSIG